MNIDAGTMRPQEHGEALSTASLNWLIDQHLAQAKYMSWMTEARLTSTLEITSDISMLPFHETTTLLPGRSIEKLLRKRFVRSVNYALTQTNVTPSVKEIIWAKLFRWEASRFLLCNSQQEYQIVPHVTNEIQDWIERVAKIPVDETGEEPDICIVEVCTFGLFFRASSRPNVIFS